MGFYKYIAKKGEKFVIKTRTGIWGTYKNVEDALHDRDLLVEANWDIGEVLASDEKDNKYYEMDLPDFETEKLKKDENKYISKQKTDGGEYFTVQKKIKGKLKRFGYYKTLDEAKEVRDELIKNNWGVLI